MNFRIADTFTASLARLTGEEQKAAKTTAFDLQMNPANPGMSFHKLDKARDKNFWSVRVSSDIRLIVHKSADSLLLCYVDHHDKAYQWAERRRLETHPTTGAAQWVEMRERVDEIVVRRGEPVSAAVTPQPTAKPSPFGQMSDQDLLSWGVPTEWLAEIRQADEDSLLVLAEKLPAEAAEALLELATGGTPQRPQTAPPGADPFAHPDAQRRFRVMQDVEELERALEFPWDQWTVFLHPAQRQWVERDHGGPARVSGSAGTGKTIVALHRAVYLARNNEDSRVLLTTFTPALAHALHTRLRRLVGRTPKLAERIDVVAIDELGERLFKFAFGKPALADGQLVRRYLVDAAATCAAEQGASATALPAKLGQGFLWGEWAEIVDPWQIDSGEGYRDIKRLGRKTRLSEAQRAAAWSIFSRVRDRLRSEKRVTRAELFTRLAAHYAAGAKLPFEHVVVDEAQDIGVPQLKFLAAFGGLQRNALFFAGDLGQRIFQLPFSWKSLGVDVRGRSRTLHVNYRTSHQIRIQADRLLGPELVDVDGNSEDRKGTVSVFNGPAPLVRVVASFDAEITAVAAWLGECVKQGVRAGELAVFVRSDAELERARRALSQAQLPYHVLDENVDTDSDEVSIGTMHLAKGLEFRCVVVMACDDEVVPLQARIDEVPDEADLKEVYDTERHLLYVACTRARDRLLVTGAEPASEFLADLS
ncbi:DNA helicase [Verminephrobacter aporrectodeae subsp. tuberculatae]|uniref:DNA 3'-5' helicase n=1 Tax=Verminephrobacter aporrectodeae subsp. tuberculatae TaxID=1110392 RepID=A0ABT3KQP2_9BURK|nr:3'-5' exonuclease [Verminephrobacter aporrectodeae]MCW5320634.1 DNA helicase [Verminephrobacter aporrectodeae subsp. tuberculatae]